MSETEESGMNEQIESLAASLSSLVPRTELNRDRLMYEAGRAAALKDFMSNRKSLRFWQVTTGFSTAVAAMLGLLLIPASVPDSPAISPSAMPPVAGLQNEVGVPHRSRSKGRDLHSELPDPSMIASIPLPAGELSYLEKRNLILSEGIDKLPARQIHSEGDSKASVPYRELLHSLDELSGFGS